MIIVEGADGTGKTTLAQTLADKFELDYRRYPGLSSEKGPQDDGIAAWWDTELRNRPPAVYDRCFYISELIYQLATPGRPLLVSGAKMIQGIYALWTAEPFIIFCQTDWETQLRIISAQERARLEGVDDHALQKISWAYDGVCAMWDNALFENVHRYDFQAGKDDTVIGKVSSYLERRYGGHTS